MIESEAKAGLVFDGFSFSDGDSSRIGEVGNWRLVVEWEEVGDWERLVVNEVLGGASVAGENDVDLVMFGVDWLKEYQTRERRLTRKRTLKTGMALTNASGAGSASAASEMWT